MTTPPAPASPFLAEAERLLAENHELAMSSSKFAPPLQHQLAAALRRAVEVIRERDEEIEVLRDYGDCEFTAEADKELKKRRRARAGKD